MKFQEIMNALKKGDFAPIYLLMGEETYFIDRIVKYIETHALSDQEKEFNQTVIYGRDTDITTIDHAARRYPMMAPRQVIIVKEAQEMKDIKDLEHYAKQPAPHTILVISYKNKKLQQNTRLYKAISKNGLVFDAKKLYDDKIPDWITGYLKRQGYPIEFKATMMLNEFLGNDLAKIANECDKLMITLEKGTTIKPSDIEQNIGISKDYNNFELQDAIGNRDVLKASHIADHFGKNPRNNSPIFSVIVLFNFFTKILLLKTIKDQSSWTVASKLRINPFFVKKYQQAAKNYSGAKVVDNISLLRAYDLKLKGVENVSTTDGELLKELIYKLMH